MYGPATLSDRYVVCLLKKGYKWPENSSNSPASSPPHDTESLAKPDHLETTKIALGHYTQGIAFTPGAIWVAYDEKKNENTGVFRLDPNTNQIVTAIQTGKSAGAAAVGNGAVWIGNFGDNSVTRIDPETNRVVATVTVGKYPFGLDVGEGSLWVTNAGSNTVSRIDSTTNAVIGTIAVGKRPAGIAVGGGFVWVANSKSKSVSRIDPKTATVVATIEAHGEPMTLTARGSDVWVSSQFRSGFSVLRIDAKSNTVVAEIPISTKGQVGGTTLLGDLLWVADRANGALWRIDVQTNTVVGGPFPVGYDATIFGVGTMEMERFGSATLLQER
jgi:YVTN family beta-propeller protein